VSVVMDWSMMGQGYAGAGQEADRVEGPCGTCDDIVARYHDQIYRYLLGMVGNVAQARSLTHDIFLTAYQTCPHTPDPLRHVWVYRIATTTALDALRQHRRLRWGRVTPDNEGHGARSATNRPRQYGERDAARAALDRLPPPQRACLLPRARDGLTIDEIAYALRLSPGNVRMILSRAKEQVRAADAAPSPR